MTRLLGSILFRIRANKIFWLALLGCAIVGMVCPWGGWQMSRQGAGITSGYCMDYYLFTYMDVVALAVAIFCGFFTGIEYNDGTMRNKISAGISRMTIYMAYLFTNALAACVLFTVYIIVDVPFARILLGKLEHFGTREVVQLLVCAYMLMIALAAIFTLIVLAISNWTLSLITCLGVTLASIFLGIYHLNILGDTVLWQAVDGVRRTRVLFLLNFLPGGQLMEYFSMSSYENWNVRIMLGGSAFFIVVSTLIGLLIFRRKELK